MRWLLCHKAGLPTVDAKLTAAEVFAWDPVIHALEVQAPFWEPGTAHGYHAITYGYLVGEVVRRISGKSLGTFWQDEIARPLDLEFWIGLPPEQEHRVATLVGTGTATGDDGEESAESADLTALLGPDSLVARALSLNGAFGDLADGFNSPVLHAAEIPAANGITNARSLARFYAALIGGVEHGPSEPLLTPEQVDAARYLPDRGCRPGAVVPGDRAPDHDRARVLDFVGVRALRRGAVVRPLGRGRVGRLRRSRGAPRRRLRDEPDVAGPRR